MRTSAISRPLPKGWTEHFDTERKIWYYVDLNSIPPRASLVPPDSVSQGHDQAWRPLPTINVTASANSCGNVQTSDTTITSAQRLYATAITSNSSSTSRPSAPIPQVSMIRHTSISARSIVDRDATSVDTSLPPTQSSSSLPPTSNLESEYIQPRYRSKRSQKSEFLSLSPFSTPLSVAKGSTGQTLYNPAVQTSTSASAPTFVSNQRFKPLNDSHRGPELNRTASLRTSHTEGHDFFSKALPPIPADAKGSDGFKTTTITSNSQHRNLYSGITEDNVFFMPTHGKVSSTKQHVIMVDHVPPSSVSPTQDGPIPSSSLNRSTDQVIFQPRPIKPLQGVSASFQDQIRETSQPTPSLEEDQLAGGVRKTPSFTRFSVGLVKAGKSEPDKDIRQDNCRPSDEDTSWTQILDSSLDESFILIDDAPS